MPGEINRRTLLGATLATPFVVPVRAAVPVPPPSGQNAGWYRFALGDFEVTVLSDGNLTVPATGLGVNADPGEVQAFLAARYLDTETNYAHTKHFLIDTGTAQVLVDVGSGERFQPSAGRLLANLAAAGIDPASITHVALTHAHPDHVWGMLDEFDELRIPEAAYTVGAAEFDWWMAEGRVDQVPEAMQAFVVGAQNALGPVAEHTAMAAGETEIVPGVRMIDTPGHTLGHMSLMVESAGEAMLVTGDAINHAHVAFEHPDWHFGFDMDKEQAVATRRRLLDMAAADRVLIAGYHLPFPGIGHAVKEGSAWRFLPALWIWGG